MKIKHEHIKSALLAWGNGQQGYVANLLAERYLDLGGKELRLKRGATWNNTQNIFARWINGDTPAQREKIQALLPAIRQTMPKYIQARMDFAESAECRQIMDIRRTIEEATEDLMGVVIAMRLQHSPKGGPTGSSLRN